MQRGPLLKTHFIMPFMMPNTLAVNTPRYLLCAQEKAFRTDYLHITSALRESSSHDSSAPPTRYGIIYSDLLL